MEPNEMVSMPAPQAPKKKPSYGGMVAILIILIGIIVAAFYFWGERIAQEPQTPEQELQSLSEQGTSTDTASIESDLSSESPDEFNQDLEQAFTELDASFEAR